MKIKEYIDGIKQCDRNILGQAITLIESSLEKDKKKANKLLQECNKITTNSMRLGISGTPGVGKSTFIEALGTHLIKQKVKVAVLTVDPSSSISKGSILGDKTRMQRLSNSELAFIRSSPSNGILGGVTHNTKDIITICEAAKFDVIIIETVGVGQSETLVKSITDIFIYLTIAQNGDALQFIKKGVFELSDIILINKSDENKEISESVKLSLKHTFKTFNNNMKKLIFTCSALNGDNIEMISNQISKCYIKKCKNGQMQSNRSIQNLFWLKNKLKDEIKNMIFNHNKIRKVYTDFNNNPSEELYIKTLNKIKKILK